MPISNLHINLQRSTRFLFPLIISPSSSSSSSYIYIYIYLLQVLQPLHITSIHRLIVTPRPRSLLSLSFLSLMAGFLSAVRRVYLSIYNWSVFVGWLQVLVLAVKTLKKESGHEHVYSVVETPLQLAQTAAVLEIFHGLVGLVRSPVSATLPQIGSRLYVTWGILYSFPETRSHILVSSLVISWSITEIIRYSFFGMKEALGFAPSWLLWLRYSTFLLLYPTGITSEVGLIYTALPYIKSSEKYCIRLPNKWNFSFDYFYVAIIALGIYVPGSPHMYRYMLGQRKKALAKSKRE